MKKKVCEAMFCIHVCFSLICCFGGVIRVEADGSPLMLYAGVCVMLLALCWGKLYEAICDRGGRR